MGTYYGANEGADFYVSEVSCEGDGCSGQKCGRILEPKSSGEHWYEIDCSGAHGRYVSIMLPGDNRILNFMEMKVYSPGVVELPVGSDSTTPKRSTTSTTALTTTSTTTTITSAIQRAAPSAATEAESSDGLGLFDKVTTEIPLEYLIGGLAGVTLACLACLCYCCCDLASRRMSRKLTGESAVKEEANIEDNAVTRTVKTNNGLPTLLPAAGNKAAKSLTTKTRGRWEPSSDSDSGEENQFSV